LHILHIRREAAVTALFRVHHQASPLVQPRMVSDFNLTYTVMTILCSKSLGLRLESERPAWDWKSTKRVFSGTNPGSGWKNRIRYWSWRNACRYGSFYGICFYVNHQCFFFFFFSLMAILGTIAAT
jgi:hypothetical protein